MLPWIAFAFLAYKRMSIRPHWWQHLLEVGVESVVNLISRVTKQPGEKFVTLIGTLAVFIATANLVGLLPGLRSPTGDVNTPLALALIVFFAVHYYGVKELGLKGYLRHLAQPSLVTLPMELVGQVSRTLALSFRLFGNIVAGAVIVAILYLLLPLLIPVPLLLFNVLIGLLQAFVFTILAAVYIGAAVEARPRAETRPSPRSPEDRRRPGEPASVSQG